MRFVVAKVLATVSGLGAIVLGSSLATAAGGLPRLPATSAAAPNLTRVEYYCSEGFAPTSGGRCVATAARDEIELYLNDPTVVEGGPVAPLPRRHHRRHRVLTLHDRY